MHEMAVTQQILSLALAEAGKVGASAITRINLKVGEWSTFEPTCLEFYFGILARDTAAADAKLAIETVPVTYSCGDCGERYQPTGVAVLCPKCCSTHTGLVSGREIYLDSIEVEK